MDCDAIRDDMLDVLYGEADPAIVRRVKDHHALCPACRDELAALRGLRRSLDQWQLALAGPRAGWGPSWRPLRGLAAAAALVLALGGAVRLSGAEFRFQRGPVAFQLGGRAGELRARLTEQEARHRREIEDLKAALGDGPHDDAALVRKVEAMIRESEARQAMVLNASLQELAEKSERQRRYDLARVSAGFSYLEGKTGQQVARTTELMGYVLQASERK